MSEPVSSQVKSIAFTACVALVCSLLLTAAATGLQDRKQRNVAVDRQKNILTAVGLLDAGQKPAVDRIERLYQENIRCYVLSGKGRIEPGNTDSDAFPVCFLVQGGQPAAYILPVNSRGLWGKIRGYIAIESDGRTVAGFSVYNHNETPGLGGEVEKPWFGKNFVGKRILDESGEFVGVGIAKGKVAETVPSDLQANFVDGISGATLTGRFLSGGLKDVLSQYEGLSRQFRSGRVSLPAGG